MAHLSHADRSALTRRALLDAAHELFATQGYAATATTAIAQRAKRSQGALQYHFTEKATLFRAVYTEQNSASVNFIAARIQAAEGATLWERVVVTTCDAFVERAADPSGRRVLYVDGPAILGRATLQEIGPGLTLVRQTFELLMAAGVITPLPFTPLVHLLWAVFFEAGRYIAHADDPATAQAETRILLLGLLDGLRPRSERRPAPG